MDEFSIKELDEFSIKELDEFSIKELEEILHCLFKIKINLSNLEDKDENILSMLQLVDKEIPKVEKELEKRKLENVNV